MCRLVDGIFPLNILMNRLMLESKWMIGKNSRDAKTERGGKRAQKLTRTKNSKRAVMEGIEKDRKRGSSPAQMEKRIRMKDAN